MKSLCVGLLAALAAPTIGNAADCNDYPFVQGINVEDVNGGTRIISTAVETVSYDDVDAIKDARDEATLEAKSLISQFMSEGIKSDQVVGKAVEETKSMQGDTKLVTRQELIRRLKTLAASSQALLRGVVPLGECYTKGKEFRVSVGIKPETISAAGNLSTGMSNSLATQPPHEELEEAPQTHGGIQRPSGMDSFSNTQGFQKF